MATNRAVESTSPLALQEGSDSRGDAGDHTNGLAVAHRRDTVPALATCRTEIERLHDRFVAWFTAAEGTDFDAIERALAPGFEMVTPDGRRVARDAVLDSIREAHGRDGPGEFDIEIRNVELLHATDDHATVRYEEWQETPDGTTGRVSTVLFETDPAAPGGLVWLDVHETWLEGPSG